MTVGFAGSSRLGERRRRRLASDADAPVKKPTRRHRIDAAHTSEPTAELDLLGRSPLHSVLPARRWKLLFLTVLSFWALVGALYLSLIGEFRPQLRPLVGIDSGQLLQTLGTVLLIGSAQWCGVIYWYRKRGRLDFAGDYRRWLLAGGTFIIALPCWTADIHRSFGQYASPRLPEAAWNSPDLCWMIPFGTAVALYGFGVLREMLPIRVRGLLLLAGMGWLFIASVALLVGPSYLEPVACRRVSLMATTVAFWSFFHCLWFQARHVVRVSNEPPKPENFQPLAIRQAVETGLAAVENTQRIATSPYRAVRGSVAGWQAARAARAETRAAEKEERRLKKEAAKAAAIADREALKQAKRDEKEAAAEAKRQAAEEKQLARDLAAEEKRKAKAAAKEAKASLPSSDEEPSASQPTADRDGGGRDERPANSNGSRRQRKQGQGSAPPAEQVASNEAAGSQEDDEDLSHLSRKERRRRRKQRNS